MRPGQAAKGVDNIVEIQAAVWRHTHTAAFSLPENHPATSRQQ